MPDLSSFEASLSEHYAKLLIYHTNKIMELEQQMEILKKKSWDSAIDAAIKECNPHDILSEDEDEEYRRGYLDAYTEFEAFLTEMKDKND
jgi:hypothetical protein